MVTLSLDILIWDICFAGKSPNTSMTTISRRGAGKLTGSVNAIQIQGGSKFSSFGVVHPILGSFHQPVNFVQIDGVEFWTTSILKNMHKVLGEESGFLSSRWGVELHSPSGTVP